MAQASNYMVFPVTRAITFYVDGEDGLAGTIQTGAKTVDSIFVFQTLVNLGGGYSLPVINVERSSDTQLKITILKDGEPTVLCVTLTSFLGVEAKNTLLKSFREKIE